MEWSAPEFREYIEEYTDERMDIPGGLLGSIDPLTKVGVRETNANAIILDN